MSFSPSGVQFAQVGVKEQQGTSLPGMLATVGDYKRCDSAKWRYASGNAASIYPGSICTWEDTVRERKGINCLTANFNLLVGRVGVVIRTAGMSTNSLGRACVETDQICQIVRSRSSATGCRVWVYCSSETPPVMGKGVISATPATETLDGVVNVCIYVQAGAGGLPVNNVICHGVDRSVKHVIGGVELWVAMLELCGE